MPRVTFDLCRVRFIQPQQLILGAPSDLTPRQIFADALRDRPHWHSHRQTWVIGNLAHYSINLGSFQLGRTRRAQAERFDEERGRFVLEEGDETASTPCVYDLEFGLVGISRRTKVAAELRTVATRLARILARGDLAGETNTEVRVDPILDPRGLLESISDAHRVRKFRARFFGPNPIDVDELFNRPLSAICSETNARSGTASIEGDLRPDIIAAIASSSSSAGNPVAAWVVDAPGDSARKVTNADQPVSLVYDDPDRPLEQVARDMVAKYSEVRGR